MFTLRDLSNEHPDATLAELSELFFEQTGIKVNGSTIARKLRQLRISRKKKTFHASERDTPEVQQERKDFQEDKPNLSVPKLIFVDESGINTGMARTYGRAPIGQRVEGAKPRNTGANISLVGALKLSGVAAIMMLTGAIDGAAFKTFVEDLLVPTLQSGDLVLMDNSTTHKGKEIAQAIQATGAELKYLPRYSPDFSPLENCWSKLKELLRGMAARTLETLEEGVKNALNQITEEDVKGWFEHCGYCIPFK